jgi:para-nitrobenzyl esterase
MCNGSPGLNGLGMGNNVVKMAKLKHQLNAAPAFTYYFTWQSPIFDGLPGAWHTADLQFCFDNSKRCEQGTGEYARSAGTGIEYGGFLGLFRSNRRPEDTWPEVDGDRS